MKITYLMHVHWNWIKQRPHFIAEGLSEYFDTTVYYNKEYNMNNLTINSSKVKSREVYRLPLSRFKIINFINKLIYNYIIKRCILKSDFLWITDPKIYKTIYKMTKHKKMIYDCMDDVIEFPYIKNNPSLLKTTLKFEKDLMMKSNIIIFSSENLKNKLIKRYNLKDKKIFVINNAINFNREEITSKLQIPLSKNIKDFFDTNKLKTVTYIGTISEWFDFDLILETLNRNKEIIILLFGPIDTSIPSHPRLIHFGPVQHENIYKIMDLSDALIMPFIINDLILSVNPVKLYEYIYSNKPSIAVRYKESEQFEDYVYLYKDNEEFFSLINKLSKDNLLPKKNVQENLNFVLDNTWEKRVDKIKEIIENRITK